MLLKLINYVSESDPRNFEEVSSERIQAFHVEVSPTGNFLDETTLLVSWSLGNENYVGLSESTFDLLTHRINEYFNYNNLPYMARIVGNVTTEGFSIKVEKS